MAQLLPQIGKRPNKKSMGYRQPRRTKITTSIGTTKTSTDETETKTGHLGYPYPLITLEGIELEGLRSLDYKGILENITDTTEPYLCGPDYVRTRGHNFKISSTTKPLTVNKRTFPKLYRVAQSRELIPHERAQFDVENYDYFGLKAYLFTWLPLQTEICTMILEYLQLESLNPCSIYCTMLSSCESCSIITREEEILRANMIELFEKCMD